ncbi:MAG: aldehyde ferredoxin oxidoreductase family protein [Candidatus Bipolaricaulis sp.]|nr:aldehyde ferredoxin oxidoreductase family protein [Candidatus Bipolaricaulis sp.]
MRKTAYVDLSLGSTEIADTPDDRLGAFLGGRGYGASLLYDLVPPGVGPLDPGNALILTSGLFSGTSWPAASRYHLTFRSPLTGCYGYANAGGKLGPFLAACGFDAVAVRGRAESPVYLLVDCGAVAILPAGDLWGRMTGETEEILHRRYPEAAVAGIGPAGEHGVRFAAVISDGGRAAARTGGGAVFGSKNLKAVVVAKAPLRRAPTAFLGEARRAAEQLLAAPSIANLSRWGTPFLTAIKNEIGDLPTRNHQRGQVSFVDRIDAEALEAYKAATKGCFGCPIRCGRVSTVPAGAYACTTAGPEYETVDSLGPQCDCGDPEAVIYANMLCNELGLDTLSTGATIAFAMECHERGLLDDAELSLEWGDPASVVEAIRRIASRVGVGDLLSAGVRAAAAALGGDARRYAMEVKGLEIPSQEGRVAKGFGLGHATSNRGADHLYALPTIDTAGLEEAARRHLDHVFPAVMDPADERYKPDLVVFSEHYCAVADALGVCKFSTVETHTLHPEDLARGACALGVEITADDLLRSGERIVNLERMYNVRLGLSAKDDRLPARFTDEPMPVRRGERVTHHVIERFDEMLARYYALRGWDDDGIPTPETLRDLGLDRWLELDGALG